MGRSGGVGMSDWMGMSGVVEMRRGGNEWRGYLGDYFHKKVIERRPILPKAHLWRSTFGKHCT